MSTSTCCYSYALDQLSDSLDALQRTLCKPRESVSWSRAHKAAKTLAILAEATASLIELNLNHRAQTSLDTIADTLEEQTSR
jgi:hypothetical protein